MASSIFRVSRTETEGQQSGPATLNKAQEPVKMRIYEDESILRNSDHIVFPDIDCEWLQFPELHILFYEILKIRHRIPDGSPHG